MPVRRPPTPPPKGAAAPEHELEAPTAAEARLLLAEALHAPAVSCAAPASLVALIQRAERNRWSLHLLPASRSTGCGCACTSASGSVCACDSACEGACEGACDGACARDDGDAASISVWISYASRSASAAEFARAVCFDEQGVDLAQAAERLLARIRPRRHGEEVWPDMPALAVA